MSLVHAVLSARDRWIASRHSHRVDRKHVQGGLVPDHGGVLQPFNQVPPDLEAGGRDQGQPEARQLGGQHRHRDQPAPQSLLAGVLPNQVAVSHDIRAADPKVRLSPGGKSFAARR